MPTLTGVHQVALTVTDVDRSVPWYERVLGFEAVEYIDTDSGQRKVFLRGPGLGVALTLVQYLTAERSTFNEHRPGLDHLTFAVPDDAVLNRWTERLTEHGVPFEIIGEDKAVAVRDPDGIHLVLTTSAP
jgi:glyoxylase I family protein